MIEKIFTIVAGIYWTCVFTALGVLDLLRVWPSKWFPSKIKSTRPSELDDQVYGQHQNVHLESVRLHYVISGPEDAPLMLMVHGFPEIWYSWRYQIKEFQKDFRVVAIDLRGYGESDRPLDKKMYRMNLLVEDLHQLVEALDYKSCVLVSHDWGGSVAWAFAAEHPAMVDRLVVMNIPPTGLWRDGFMSGLKQFLASGYIFFFFFPYLPELYLSRRDCFPLNETFTGKYFGVQSGIMTSKDVECYKYFFRQKGAFTSAINIYRANLWPPAYRHKLDYPMPVKVIWGCKDRALTLGTLESIVKAIPKVDVTRIEEACHFVQMDQPEKVNQAIREFLSSTAYKANSK